MIVRDGQRRQLGDEARRHRDDVAFERGDGGQLSAVGGEARQLAWSRGRLERRVVAAGHR